MWNLEHADDVLEQHYRAAARETRPVPRGSGSASLSRQHTSARHSRAVSPKSLRVGGMHRRRNKSTGL